MSEFQHEGGDLSDTDFNTLLAGLVGKELTDDQRETLEEGDTTVSKGLTVGESTTPGSAPAEQPEAPGAAPDATEQTQDDPLAALVAAHGGDVEAALAAVVQERDNAQSLIGRQGSELGELRKLIEERLPAEEEEPEWEMPAQIPFVDEQTATALDSMYAENGGPNTMEWIATNRPDLFDAALRTWGSYEPFEAARFATRYEANLAEYERAQQGGAPAADPRMEEFLAERSLQQAVAAAREGVDDATWAAIKDDLPNVLGTLPAEVQGMVVSPNGDTQKAGVALAIEVAKGRLIANAAQKAQADADAAAAATKQATMVATGSLRPVAKGQASGSGEMTSDERHAAFKQALLATETTSVADGLVESR